MVKQWHSKPARVGLNPLPVAVRANIRHHSALRESWRPSGVLSWALSTDIYSPINPDRSYLDPLNMVGGSP